MTMRDGPINVADDPCRTTSGNAQRLCWDARPEDVVLQDAGGRIVYSFRALCRSQAHRQRRRAAASLHCGAARRNTRDLSPGFALAICVGGRGHCLSAPTNLYILDLGVGAASSSSPRRATTCGLADQQRELPAGGRRELRWFGRIPFCGPSRGKTRIFDRKAGTITELKCPGTGSHAMRRQVGPRRGWARVRLSTRRRPGAAERCLRSRASRGGRPTTATQLSARRRVVAGFVRNRLVSFDATC